MFIYSSKKINSIVSNLIAIKNKSYVSVFLKVFLRRYASITHFIAQRSDYF